jgi:ATP-binding cassette, subfamily B, bacterial
MARRNGGASTDEAVKVPVTKEGLRNTLKIFKYLTPYKTRFLFGLFLLIVSGGITLVFPRVTGGLVDAATGAATSYDRNTIALGLVGILVLQGLFSFLRIIVFAQVSERVLRDIRSDVYERMISLPMAFFEKRRVGELTSRITADVGQLQDVLAYSLAEFIRQITTLVVGISIILITSTRLTLVMLSSFPLMILGAVLFGRFIRKLSREVTDELAAANTVAEETLQGIQTVKSFSNERYEAHRYGKRLSKVMELALQTAKYRGLFVSFVIFSIFGGIVLVLWYGLGLVSEGQITIGELISFIIYTTFIGAAAGGLGDLYAQLQKTVGASARILEILEEPGEVAIRIAPKPNEGHSAVAFTEMQPINRLKGLIEFDRVRFRYPTRMDVEVLKGIQFTLKAGEVTALVGQSGAGKTTIAQLLMQFHLPSEGEIRIDGLPATSYSIEGLRGQIGLVPQDVLLFGGTLRENIEYGKPGATDEEIIAAAKRANAWPFIDSFPEKLETIVGERGIKLSGGQRQRIAIARAMLKDPAILILDEATNALDAESEAQVQEALQELMKGRTTLVIAHRLHTIRNANQILVLADGAVLEAGTYQELARREESAFANLLRLQQMPEMDSSYSMQ